MADKRQFSMQIIDSDDFLEMPLSAQALYLHLSMRADDDGFVPNASRIMKLVNANKNDYDLLVAKAYVIEFDAVNDNVPETKMKMGNMRKVYANVYYDDNARIVYEEFPK